MSTEWDERVIHSDKKNAGLFHVRVKKTDQTPVSGHKAPEDSVLVIEGADRAGHKSAHRNLARSLGYGEKVCRLGAANYDHKTGHVTPMVTTYWI